MILQLVSVEHHLDLQLVKSVSFPSSTMVSDMMHVLLSMGNNAHHEIYDCLKLCAGKVREHFWAMGKVKEIFGLRVKKRKILAHW